MSGMEPLLSLEEAAKLLGVSSRTVRRALEAGDLQPIRIGRRILIEPAAIRAYIDRKREARLETYLLDGYS